MYRLHFPPGEYRELRVRLLPANSQQEQAAFAYFRPRDDQALTELRVTHWEALAPADFVSQEDDYLEIADDVRRRVIKTAHDTSCGVAEFHSHPFNLPAEFSTADYVGLCRTVPHMLWRLKSQPYVAVVIGPNDYDGLVGRSDNAVQTLAAIVDGDSQSFATGRSKFKWP